MPSSLGQIVYLFKDKLASEVNRTSCHTRSMPQRQPRPSALRAAEPPRSKWHPMAKDKFASIMGVRLAEARGTKFTQGQMDLELGLQKGTYSKYENRSMMPANLIARFCELTGADPKVLLKDPR